MFRGVPPAEGDDPDLFVPSFRPIAAKLGALVAEIARANDVGASRPEARPGNTIARFKLLRELGRGGFSVVFEAVDRELGRPVALKVVRPLPGILNRGAERLMREAEAVGRLAHPHIVELLDFGQGPSGTYLVFELLRGRSMVEALRTGPLPFECVIQVGLAVSRALVHAHAAGVVHGDLTASNVHVGDDGIVKVLDFGLARLFGGDRAGEGGTPAYMAPEQWEGAPADARSDLFGLGVVLFQALSGRYPYDVRKGWSDALEPGETPELPSISGPRRVRDLVRSLIHRSAEARPESALVVRQEFLALSGVLTQFER